MSKLLAAAAVLAALMGCVESKGASGASNGGGYRGWKGGVYSRSHRMMYYPIFFVGGHRYNGGRSGRGGVVPVKDQGNNVFCKRDVRLGDTTYADPNTITLNSTRYCYRQVTPTNGAPENLKIESTWLDVYQWKLNAGNGRKPSVEMIQFDDKDDNAPNSASLWKVVIDKITSQEHTNGTSSSSLDTSTLTWKATKPAPRSKPVWGYPATYSKDEARLLTISVTGYSSSNTPIMVLTFTIAGDFAEDAIHDHVFMRPSGMKVDIAVKNYPEQFTTTGDLGVDLVVITSKPKSELMVATPVVGKYVTEYDPRLRNRLEIGKMTGTSSSNDRSRQFLSWSATTSYRSLCSVTSKRLQNDTLDNLLATSSNCAKMVKPTNCPSGICPICTTTPPSAACSLYGIPSGHSAYVLSFIATASAKSIYSSAVQRSVFTDKNYIAWSLTIGTYDHAESVAAATSSI